MLGTEKIEKIVESLSHVAVAAKKISADKKVDLQDIPAAMELLVRIPEIVSAFSDLGETWKEVEDVDVTEVIQLITLINERVKDIERA